MKKAPQLSSLEAGEALDPLAPCYIASSDGKVYMTNATAANEAASVDGFTPRAYKASETNVTLIGKGAKAHYADSGLTPGATLYAGATAGRLDDSATVGDTVGVAKAYSATHIRITRDF